MKTPFEMMHCQCYRWRGFCQYQLDVFIQRWTKALPVWKLV